MRRIHKLSVGLALLAASVPGQAGEGAWFPIDLGRIWVYSSGSAAPVVVSVESATLFEGEPVHSMEWSSGPVDYFSRDAFGRVYFHGQSLPNGGRVVLEPPFLRMDSSLDPGHEWSTIYNLKSYNPAGELVAFHTRRASYEVLGVGNITVPAGTFEAVEVLVTEGVYPASADGALERRASFREFYAQGVGWIRRSEAAGSGVSFELRGYGLNGVSAGKASLGEVKSRYRH